MKYFNVYIDGVLSDITVEDGIITDIASCETGHPEYSDVFFALPGLVNMHTHSAMTLLRSAGSGLPLHRWLQEAIFPREAKLTPQLIYKGACNACDEMLSTGTTAFNDMYFCIESTIQAAREKGMRANVALSVTDNDFDNPNLISDFMKILTSDSYGSLTVSIAPHSIYAVSGRHLQYLADFAKENGTLFHMHLSETLKERKDCLRENGIPPVVYLDKLGIFDKVGEKFIGAHSLWLDPDEIRILGDVHATVAHCPNSNLKLGSGYKFLYTELRDAGVNVTLATDGCASSDNLDMIEAMKTMSLLQKGIRNDPSVLPANEVFGVATANGRRALGLPDNTIKRGNCSDFFLVNINNIVFEGIDYLHSTPAQIHEEFLNRLIYAGNGSLVSKTVTPLS